MKTARTLTERVFATGIGIVSPLRPFEGIDRFWKALCAGEDAVKMMRPPLVDLGGEWPMAGIDVHAYPDRASTEEKFTYISEKALSMALKDAGPDLFPPAGHQRAGIVFGTVLGNILQKEKRAAERPEEQEKAKGGVGRPDSLSYFASGLAGKYGLKGPALTVSTACASGTDALGIAARHIVSGRADVMIAGGADVLSDFAIAGFNSLQAFAGERVRPFDRLRDGLALGEGAAFIILESEEHARARGAEPYGKVLGYCSRSDANHLTGPHREGRGLAEAIQCALTNAAVAPSDVQYINAHGTGTPYNDLMETKAVKTVFAEKAYEIPVSSTKSMLGHSFGAAGVIEAIICLLAVKTHTVPPTINYREKDPECDLDYVPNEARKHHVSVAMSQSAGFGGQNSVIIVAQP